MTDYTKEQLLDLIKLTCPRCAEGVKLVYRKPYNEFAHEKHSAGQTGGHSFSHTICMATHLRVAYKEVLGG